MWSCGSLVVGNVTCITNISAYLTQLLWTGLLEAKVSLLTNNY
jgi:hypothetical protein